MNYSTKASRKHVLGLLLLALVVTARLQHVWERLIPRPRSRHTTTHIGRDGASRGNRGSAQRRERQSSQDTGGGFDTSSDIRGSLDSVSCGQTTSATAAGMVGMRSGEDWQGTFTAFPILMTRWYRSESHLNALCSDCAQPEIPVKSELVN